MNKELENTLEKIDDNKSGEKLLLKRISIFFLLGVIGLFAYAVINELGLSNIPVYAKIQEAGLGIVLGMLVVGLLITSGLLFKLRKSIRNIRTR